MYRPRILLTLAYAVGPAAFRPRESRRYRFVVSFPHAAADAHQGASVSLDFVWYAREVRCREEGSPPPASRVASPFTASEGVADAAQCLTGDG